MSHEGSAPDRAAGLRGLLLFVLTEAVISAAFLNYFCRVFEIDRWLIAVHLPLVLLFCTVAAAGGWITAGLAASTLALLYAADFASNHAMGTNITYKLVGLWFDDWRQGGNLLSLSSSVYALAVAAVAAIMTLHYGYRQALVDGRRAALAWAQRRPVVAGVVFVAVAVGYGGYFRELAWRTPRSELLSSDPILAFLRRSVAVYDDSYVANAVALAAREKAARSAYPKGLSFDRKHVIVIIADSLRADHMQICGYHRPTTPFLARLEAEGKLRKVTHGTSTCAESNCGILSTLFSKSLPNQIPDDFSIDKLLKDQGYKTHFVLSGNHDWRDLQQMYGREQSSYFDGRQSSQFHHSDDRVVFEGLDLVPAATGPAFFYFHLMSTHLIGTKLDAYRQYNPSDVKTDWDALFAGTYDRETVVNNYDNGVRQADAMIERLFAELDRKGYLADSIIAILSDHGEALGERAKTGFGHVTSLHQELINIPILFYDDSTTAYRNLDVVTQIDVAPTLIERLGITVPEGWEGQSALSQGRRLLSRHQTSLKTPCYGLVYRPDGAALKYIRCFIGRREEVFDLQNDPGERVNIRDQIDPALLEAFRRDVMPGQ